MRKTIRMLCILCIVAAVCSAQKEEVVSGGTNQVPDRNESLGMGDEQDDTPKEALLDSSSDGRQEVEPAVKSTGSLTVFSNPDSAVVILNNEPKGKAPIVFTDLPAGQHTIILKKKGYFAKKATVQVNAGSETEVKLDLVGPATLSIATEPAGAALMLNGKEKGATPFAENTLQPGTYEIVLSMDGYKKERHSVTLQSGGRESILITLMPLTEKEPAAEKKAAAKDKSKASSVLDKVALGVFAAFTLIILLIELTQ